MSRRSRRAKQSQKRSSRKGSLKWLAWVGVAVVFLGVVGLVMGYQAIRKYLKSDDFRVMLGREIGGMMGGEASFSSFQWTGWEVEVDNFDFAGKGGIQSVQGDNIDASVDIGAVWEGIYRVDDIRVSHVRLAADFRGREETTNEPEPEYIVEDTKKEGEELGFWSRFLPDKVEVNRVDIGSVDCLARTDDGEWSVKNVGAVVTPGAGEGVYDLELRGGDIRSPMALLDTLSLQNAKARYSKNRFHLISSDLDALDRARVTMEGNYSLDEGSWTFRGDVVGAKVEELVAEDWKQRLMGPLKIDYRISGQPEKDVKIDGKLEIKDGVLTALPVLDRIAAYANTVRFRRLALSEASLDFSKEGSRLNLTNIRLASEGLVRLEGDMRLSGDRITYGRFQLGITPGTLAHLPGAETKVFKQGELGLLWAPLVISGTVDAPQEDLSERLIAAAKERMFEVVPETGVWVLKHGGAAVDEATRSILAEEGIVLGENGILKGATDMIKKGTETLNGDPVEGVIDVGRDAVELGVGTLFDIFGSPIKKEE